LSVRDNAIDIRKHGVLVEMQSTVGNTNARARAARDWYGYGRWDAPYWFVGMEPGGQDDPIWYDAWVRLGATELSDCRAHHLGSNYVKWHGNVRPPTQTTWRRLIALLLGYEGRPADLNAVSVYQRDHWGSAIGNTALPEVSGIRAASQATVVDRLSHRKHRTGVIRARFQANQPEFAVFYGTHYRAIYEEVVGKQFDERGFTWSGRTLCVLVHHPAGRSIPVEMKGDRWWVEKGREMRAIINDPCSSRSFSSTEKQNISVSGVSTSGSITSHLTTDRPVAIQKTLHRSCGIIKILVVGNPKLVGSKSFLRFDCYSDGMSIADYEAKVRSFCGESESRKCTADIAWDTDHRFIEIV
jgi:hypothetical protein